MIKNIIALLRSGMVRRWHTNPEMRDCGEQNAEHQWEVAMIALHVEPNLSREGLIYALTHDAGEMSVGDMAYDIKQADPALAKMLAELELRARAEIIGDFGAVHADERAVIKAADWIAAYARMTRHCPGLRFRKDWIEQRLAVEKLLADEGYEGTADDIFEATENGRFGW